MKPLRTLTHAIALASLMTAASFSVQAQDILISGTAIEDDVVTKVLAIDMDKRLVTVAGPNDTQVPIQVSEQAKALGNLKVGDDVNVHVTRSVATVLERDAVMAGERIDGSTDRSARCGQAVGRQTDGAPIRCGRRSLSQTDGGTVSTMPGMPSPREFCPC